VRFPIAISNNERINNASPLNNWAFEARKRKENEEEDDDDGDSDEDPPRREQRAADREGGVSVLIA